MPTYTLAFAARATVAICQVTTAQARIRPTSLYRRAVLRPYAATNATVAWLAARTSWVTTFRAHSCAYDEEYEKGTD